jgi:hypothetical protein
LIELREFFSEAIDGLQNMIASEFDPEELEILTTWLESNKQAMLSWFVHGAWYAERVRYKGCYPSQVNYVKECINRVNLRFEEIEGVEYTLSYDMSGNCEFKETR